jgi:glycosyltransferase involved in cell wall biosynthesis
MSGLVREVILADAGSTDATLQIAEDAGARVVRCDGAAEARSEVACGAARADWLLLIEPGAVAPPGWEQAAADHMNGATGKPAAWGAAGLWPFSRPAQAVLIPRRLHDPNKAAPGWTRRLAARAVRLKVG